MKSKVLLVGILAFAASLSFAKEVVVKDCVKASAHVHADTIELERKAENKCYRKGFSNSKVVSYELMAVGNCYKAKVQCSN